MSAPSAMYALIERLCRERGTNVTVMCRNLEITRSVLSELKSGRTRQLSSDYTARIAAYFGVTVEFLLGQPELETYAEPPEELPSEFELLGRKMATLSPEQKREVFHLLEHTVDQVVSLLYPRERREP